MTLHELDDLAYRASVGCESPARLPRDGEGSAKNAKRRKKVHSQRVRFAIPESVCRLQFDELPITTRLANVLRSIGAKTLGDLQGCTPFELLQYKAYGWRTAGEIQQLIERAISGEFEEAQI